MTPKEGIEEILLTVNLSTGNIRVEASVPINAHRLIGILEAAKIAVVNAATMKPPKDVVESFMTEMGIKEKGEDKN